MNSIQIQPNGQYLCVKCHRIPLEYEDRYVCGDCNEVYFKGE